MDGDILRLTLNIKVCRRFLWSRFFFLFEAAVDVSLRSRRREVRQLVVAHHAHHLRGAASGWLPPGRSVFQAAVGTAA